MRERLKKLSLVFLSLLCVFALTGCVEDEYEIRESQIECVVVACEKGDFKPNQTYLTMSNTALAKNDFNKYNYYRNLAYAMGVQEYKITVNVDGSDHVLTKDKEYEVGSTISVKKKEYYDGSTLVKTEYR